MFTRECGWCHDTNERVFTDSWTGLELCLACVGEVANHVTNSPYSEGDNLHGELRTRCPQE